MGYILSEAFVTAIARRLEGRFALITGASRGIGRAVALRFAQEGAIVAVNHWRDGKEAAKTLAECGAAQSGPHMAVEADIADEAAVEAMIAQASARWGRLDILVNNAGIQTTTPGDSFATTDLRRVLDVDLLAPALVSRAALAHFLSRPGGGCIINTTSVHEKIPKPGYGAYAMAKAGLGHLTRTLALEFADRGIRVNAVAPGAVVTAMNSAWIDDPVARAGVESHIPMGFAARPEDIAPVYAFLASEDARYITGQTLYACGGLTLYGDFKSNWAS